MLVFETLLLAVQHVVWTDGAHLPQSIRVAPGAPIRIAR
jgi:hypothetical protein